VLTTDQALDVLNAKAEVAARCQTHRRQHSESNELMDTLYANTQRRSHLPRQEKPRPIKLCL
jgi:hypothetical protein